MGPGSTLVAALNMRQDGYRQTFESATGGEHTKQVDADKDEPDSQGTQYGMFSDGSGLAIVAITSSTEPPREKLFPIEI